MTKISVSRKWVAEMMLTPIINNRAPYDCYINFDKWKQEVEKAFEACKADVFKFLDMEKEGLSQKDQQMLNNGSASIITFERLRNLTLGYMEREILLIPDVNKKLSIFGKFMHDQVFLILGEKIRLDFDSFFTADKVIEHKTGTYLFFPGLYRDSLFKDFAKIYNEEKPLIDHKFKIYDTSASIPLSSLHRIVSSENSLKDVKVSLISLYRISVFLNDKLHIGDIYRTMVREYSEEIRLLASIDKEGLSDTEIDDIIMIDEAREQYSKARMFESRGDSCLEHQLGGLLYQKTFVDLSLTTLEALLDKCRISHLAIEDLESFRGFSLIKQNDTTYRLSRRIIERLQDME